MDIKVIKGSNWDARRINPMEFLRRNMAPDDFDLVGRFAKFNPKADFKYKRREQSAHDGTLMFEHELVAKTLLPVIRMQSWYRPDGPPPPEGWTEYELGWLWVLSVYGHVDVPAGRIAGMKQRTFMRVKSTRHDAGAQFLLTNL